MRRETILNIFPSHDERQRLVVAIEQEEAQHSRLVLRQETFSDDVGWFVQSCVAVEPEQVAGLKMSLGGSSTRSIQSPPQQVPRVPAILRLKGASAVNAG